MQIPSPVKTLRIDVSSQKRTEGHFTEYNASMPYFDTCITCVCSAVHISTDVDYYF